MTFVLIFLRLVAAWILFVFAVVNIVNSIFRYLRCYDDSYGISEMIKLVMYATALAGWTYLLFY